MTSSGKARRAPYRTPRWARVLLVCGVALIAGATSYLAYRQSTKPKTFTVAAGSFEGDAPKLVTAIATRLAATGSPVRLKVIEKPSIIEATAEFSAGKADLAVVRADVGDLSSARAVVVLTHAVLLIVAPPEKELEGLADLRGKQIGVIDEAVNRSVLAAISTDMDGSARGGLQFRNMTVQEGARALQSKQVQAILAVIPITDRYLNLLRDMIPRSGKTAPQVVPVDAAGAIAAIHKQYESYELPKGTFRGSPPVPDEDLTTLRVPFHLVARKDLDKDVVAALTKALMEARRDLLTEQPLLSQMATPSTDKDALIPVHPGTATYLEGEQKSFFDRYGDYFFYGPMFLGFVASALAAGRKFVVSDPVVPAGDVVADIFELRGQLESATSPAALDDIEARIDALLIDQLQALPTHENGSEEAAVLSLALQRLQYLLSCRRAELRVPTAGEMPALIT